MDDFKDYTVKYKLGTIGDMTTEWWNQEDWDNYAKYVERIKLDGKYLQEEEVTISVKPCPMFDNIKPVKSNYSFALLDFTK